MTSLIRLSVPHLTLQLHIGPHLLLKLSAAALASSVVNLYLGGCDIASAQTLWCAVQQCTRLTRLDIGDHDIFLNGELLHLLLLLSYSAGAICHLAPAVSYKSSRPRASVPALDANESAE